MSTDKHAGEKELSDLSEQPLTDAAAENVKGGMAPPIGIPITRPPVVPKPINPRGMQPCI